MTGAVAAAAIAAAGGVWLVGSGLRHLRPDPIRRATADHHIRALGGAPPLIDRFLGAWDARVGPQRQVEALSVLRRDRASHRTAQVRVAAGACLVAVAILVPGVTPAAVLWAIAAVPAALATQEFSLQHRAARRREGLGDQTVLLSQYLALCATAGLTAAESFDRSAGQIGPPMRPWVDQVVAEVRSGRSLEESLAGVSGHMQVPGFTRLVDTVATANCRGTPLAATLMSQVADARNQHHARLLERAGRSEIVMLVPIVFLVLPSVVAVAVYPGFLSLMSI